MAYQRRVPLENRSHPRVFGFFKSPGSKFALVPFLKVEIHQEFASFLFKWYPTPVLSPRPCPHCCYKSWEPFLERKIWLVHYIFCFNDDGFHRWSEWSVVSFVNIFFDMSTLTWSKCIDPPWNFAIFFHAKWRHIWNTCSNPSFLVSMSMSIYFEGVF